MSLSVVWFFIGTLVLCALLVQYVPAVGRAMTLLAGTLETRAFPSVSPYEFNKFALLRILFGLIVLIRGVHVYGLLLESERFSALGLWAGAEMIAGALLALGLLSQWALLFLIGPMWQYGDVVVAKSTLGNDIGAMLATLLLLVNAGKYLSLDALLIKRVPGIRRALLYYGGAPSREGIFFAKLGGLAGYWAVCVYSISMHLNEPAWMDGSAGPLLLSNNFMSTWFEYFSAWFSGSEFAVALAKGSLWMMMLWYPAILPLVLLGGLFRKYVIVWGWLFFALSLFGLKLGYLAEIEVLFWLALFWSFLGLDQRNGLEVFYDDRCNLCDRTVQAITFLDIFGLIRLKPLSQNQAELGRLGISMDQALNDLYGVRRDDRAVFRGYDLYLALTRSLVLLWPLWPILRLGKVLSVGPLVYRFVAVRRTRMFGVCELPRRKFLRSDTVEITRSRMVQGVALHVGVLVILYLLGVPAPYLGWAGLATDGARAAHIYGITPIDVFNKTDLRMAENWFVLRSSRFDESVPVFAANGSRLSMHRSDRVYFGNTLRFRRGVIGSEACQFENWKSTVEYLSKIYLQERGAPQGDYGFTYQQLYQPLVPSDYIAHNRFAPVPVRVLCELPYTVAYLK